MEASFRKAFKVFKYLSILFTVAYWIYIVIDDFVFIEKYWNTYWLEYLSGWTIYFLVYFLGFSFYFWIISVMLILIYHKIIKPAKNKRLSQTPDK